ncbi:MAG: bifunctional transcriptional activator/DNA repair enzyme AdaA [Thermoplasmataceae archaeon]
MAITRNTDRRAKRIEAGRIGIRPETALVHNAQLDSNFIYGNRRTKIYGYKFCPSRMPSEDRIIRFDNPAEAEKSGYRLCRHCKETMKRNLEIVRIADGICDYIKSHYTEKITLSSIGKAMGISSGKTSRIFKDALGVSLGKYLDEYRIVRLREKLRSGSSVSAAVYAVGHNSMSWLYTDSRSKLGMTPSRYRKGSKGESISYSVADTYLGKIVVAYTDKGLCAVTVVDSTEAAEEYLRKEFPRALLSESEDTHKYIEGILAYLQGSSVNIPMVLAGTEFQLRVWSALRTIPFGSTVTYSDIAEMIGHPLAVRAVANACARNPLPLIIPCHRVVRKNGELGGYGLGIDRKKKLLEQEGSFITGDRTDA